jgi:hypothetical protein
MPWMKPALASLGAHGLPRTDFAAEFLWADTPMVVL